MAFNITTWSKRGRDFGRGDPPPRGSLEYVAVGDMWQPLPSKPQDPAARATPARPARPAASSASPTGLDPWLVALGGAACLGISFLLRRRPKQVAVPDAYPEEKTCR